MEFGVWVRGRLEEKLTMNDDLYIAIRQLIKDIMDEVPDAGFSQNDLLVRSMAKSMAIKTGVSLNSEEREHLVNQLFMCKEPSISPSNQAVIITLDANDLDKKFI